LAFDDFGKGAARLQELCEAAPDYVKFDRQFAHELDSTPRRMSMVRALVSMMNEMNIRTVLEGVETEAEAEVSLKAGFDLAQGWHFGRPTPIDTL
jgi:EAL domain-containing protein (putative c-di-GMP-specific phosphodiesterase class I)